MSPEFFFKSIPIVAGNVNKKISTTILNSKNSCRYFTNTYTSVSKVHKEDSAANGEKWTARHKKKYFVKKNSAKRSNTKHNGCKIEKTHANNSKKKQEGFV